MSPLISAAEVPLLCSAGRSDQPQWPGFSAGGAFPRWQDGFHSTRDVLLFPLLAVLFLSNFASEAALS